MTAPPLPTPAHALFLDFDGTLVELADHPDRVRVPASLAPLLVALEGRLGGALAVLTGRRLESFDAHVAPFRLRGAGLHGAQLRRDPALPADEAPQLADIAAALRARYADDAQIWVEDKGAAVAVHYRAAPARAAEVEAAVRAAVVAEGIEIVAGKCVYEARVAGYDKGAALRTLMQAPPFFGRIPMFAGDDTTDEDAIAAAQALGGVGIKVGTGASAAAFRLAGPEAVHGWLRRALAALAAA